VLKLSAGDGALTSSANITIIVNPKPALPGIPIPQTKLQATASSSRHYNEPPFAIDNKPATYWLSSRYSTSQPTAYITFSLGQKYKVTGLDYLPSPLTDELGTRSLILSHKIYTSLDGTTFQQAASGNWAADKTKKQTAITATEATHIRLEALPPTSANLPSYDPRADYYAAAAEINIYYLSENQPPKITAGPDLDVILPATAHLDAVVTDDGLPQNSAVTVQWAVLSGPGTVTFTNPYAIDTQAAFSATGAYYLQFTASDTDLTISDTIKVNVYPTGYQYPPDVNAGEDIALYLPDTLVQMKGLVSDDGLPNGTLTATWSQQSGPAQAVIAQPGQPDTQVSFPQTGVYVLRLTAFDGGKYGYDEININVLPRQAFSLAFDFGTYNSPVHPDTIRITQNTTYAPGGYGWLDTYKHQAIDRANGNNLERDFISDTLKGTFKVDLLNGTYNITVISGDSLYAHDELMVKANGLPVAEHITSQPMQWQEAGFSVVVDEGTLVLEFSDEGGNNNLWVVNGILISLKDSFNKANIIEKMKLVNDAWITLNPDSGDNNWGRATYFEGNMAMYRIYPNQTYYDYALSWANKHNWTLKDGATTRIAEYQAAGKVYIELYEYEPDPKKISMITSSIQNMVNSTRVDDWWWADALHMAMPAFAELGALYKNPAYTEKMYALYNHTKTLRMGRGLYNTTDKLWWRDASFLPPYTAPNGQDCFWSRGNGWVIAAHAKMLDIMTSNQSTTQDAHYAEYVQCLKDMAAALKAVQRDDGFWNVSLHDPDHFGGPEASGTAFFTYALAWGINSGNLNRADYLSTVTKAWNALANLAVHPDGRLGYVQGVGMDPSSAQPVTYNSTSDFGVGAFLLAGSEVYKLAPDPID
jgi:rhamnogalacturonyl hydrolase YesR